MGGLADRPSATTARDRPGGYAINPGSGNHDYWTEGVAVTRHLGDRFLLGV